MSNKTRSLCMVVVLLLVLSIGTMALADNWNKTVDGWGSYYVTGEATVSVNPVLYVSRTDDLTMFVETTNMADEDRTLSLIHIFLFDSTGFGIFVQPAKMSSPALSDYLYGVQRNCVMSA